MGAAAATALTPSFPIGVSGGVVQYTSPEGNCNQMSDSIDRGGITYSATVTLEGLATVWWSQRPRVVTATHVSASFLSSFIFF